MNETTNPKQLDEQVEQQNIVEKGGDAEEVQETEQVETETLDTEVKEQEVESSEETVSAEPEPAKEVPADISELSSDKVYTSLEELDSLEKEYSDEEFESLAKIYDETLSEFMPGQVVLGKVLAVNDKEVSVDIGFKSEGVIPIDEFADPSDVVVGDTIEVYIDDIEDADGYLVLSKKKADFMRVWDEVVKSYERGDIIKGKCVRRIKGGIVVDLGGVDAFLPGSQIDVRPIRDFDALIGQEMEFKIVKVNHMRKNIVVSHRVLVEEEMKGQREKILEELERGQILEGTVKNITDFGVFIDLGGVDGLLHINDLSWGRVSHPSEIVSLDEKIKVVVLDFNEQKDRISLGLKQLQPHPWEDVEEKYPVGSVVKGKIVSISDYGAFVELEKGVEGLIHISEMSWTQHIKHPSKVLAVGETVEAKVLSIQKEERKISLGLKQLEPDPWESLAERYPVGSRHKGVVRNLTNFGAFVELEDGIDGLIHISDLSWTKKIRHPGEVVKKGDEIDVVVLNVDKENRRISLGYKQTQDNPWDYLEEKYKPGTQTEGKVVRLIEKGLIVELPDVVDGFVPISHLAKDNINKPADGYSIDEVLDLTVIEFNKDNKKIVLSETAGAQKRAAKAKEAAEAAEAKKAEAKAEEQAQAEAEPATAEETAATEAETVSAEEAAPVEAAEQAEAATEEKEPVEEPAAEEAASQETPEESAAEEAEAPAEAEPVAEPEAVEAEESDSEAEATEEPKTEEAVATEETEAVAESDEEEAEAAESAAEEAKAEEPAAPVEETSSDEDEQEKKDE